jgi:hypothetical protein
MNPSENKIVLCDFSGTRRIVKAHGEWFRLKNSLVRRLVIRGKSREIKNGPLFFLFVGITIRHQNALLFLSRTFGKRCFGFWFTGFRIAVRVNDGLHRFGIDGDEFHGYGFLFGS